MGVNGQAGAGWGYAVEGSPTTMLRVALSALSRDGSEPHELPRCNGDSCDWVRRVARCLGEGTCRAAVLFCQDAGRACCVANKVPGVRAAAVWTVAQALRAVEQFGANLLVVEMHGRTFYECKELLRICRETPSACPPGVACVLQELDGHAHR